MNVAGRAEPSIAPMAMGPATDALSPTRVKLSVEPVPMSLAVSAGKSILLVDSSILLGHSAAHLYRLGF